MSRMMAAQRWRVTGATSWTGLLDMMRYDGMRFSSQRQDLPEAVIRELSHRSCGLIPTARLPVMTIVLVKDCVKGWEPTFDRWESFGLEISMVDPWSKEQLIGCRCTP